MKKIFADLQRDNYLQKSAALTYTTLFAIVPLLTVIYSMLSAIPALHGIGQQIQGFIFSNFVPSAGNAISQYLADFSRQARNLTAVGMLFLLFTALLMLRTIDHNLNTIFHTTSNRKGIGCFLLYWAILTLGPLLLGLGFAATSYLTTIKLLPNLSDFSEKNSILAVILLRLVSVLFKILALTFVYLAVPNCKVKLTHAIAGALFVACISYFMRGAFELFFQFSHNYELIYGAFAFVPIFLIWIYLNWLIILIGACIVNALRQNNYQLQRQTVPPMIIACIILSELHRAFEKGDTLTYKQITQTYKFIRADQWDAATQWLVKKNTILALPNNGFSLLRPLHSLHAANFVSTCPWPIPENTELNNLQNENCMELQSLINHCKQINDQQKKLLNITMDELLEVN